MPRALGLWLAALGLLAFDLSLAGAFALVGVGISHLAGWDVSVGTLFLAGLVLAAYKTLANLASLLTTTQVVVGALEQDRQRRASEPPPGAVIELHPVAKET